MTFSLEKVDSEDYSLEAVQKFIDAHHKEFAQMKSEQEEYFKNYCIERGISREEMIQELDDSVKELRMSLDASRKETEGKAE